MHRSEYTKLTDKPGGISVGLLVHGTMLLLEFLFRTTQTLKKYTHSILLYDSGYTMVYYTGIYSIVLFVITLEVHNHIVDFTTPGNQKPLLATQIKEGTNQCVPQQK